MTLPEILQFVSATCAVASCACALAVAARNRRWRETDEAKHLLDRVDRAESRLDALEPRVEGLATKEDMAALRGEVKAVCKAVDDTVVPAIRRIEGYMMEVGK